MEKSKTDMRYIKTVLLLVMILYGATVHAGEVWPKPRGSGYFKLFQWFVISDRHFTDAGERDPNVTTGLFNTSIYGEWGFTDRITGVVYFPFFSRTYMNNLVSATTGNIIVKGEAVNSVGDAEVGIRVGLVRQGLPYSLTATLTLGLPFGEDAGGTEMNLQTGDGEFNQMIQVGYGRSFQMGSSNSYVSASAGFNNRTNDYSDEIRLAIELGVQVIPDRLWLIGKLHRIESLENGKDAAEVVTTSVFANNMELTSLTGEVALHFTENLGFSATIAYPLGGRIIFSKPAYSAGIFLDLR
jgi:hypothetical protein